MSRSFLPGAWIVAAALFLCAYDSFAQTVDADAAQALLKKSDCGKCHAVDKKKGRSVVQGNRDQAEGQGGR